MFGSLKKRTTQGTPPIAGSPILRRAQRSSIRVACTSSLTKHLFCLQRFHFLVWQVTREPVFKIKCDPPGKIQAPCAYINCCFRNKKLIKRQPRNPTMRPRTPSLTPPCLTNTTEKSRLASHSSQIYSSRIYGPSLAYSLAAARILRMDSSELESCKLCVATLTARTVRPNPLLPPGTKFENSIPTPLNDHVFALPSALMSAPPFNGFEQLRLRVRLVLNHPPAKARGSQDPHPWGSNNL